MENYLPSGHGSTGLPRPAGFESLLEQMSAARADWGKILRDCSKICDFNSDGLSCLTEGVKSRELTPPELMELEHRSMAFEVSVVLLLLARVGKEVAEWDRRLSAVEKELNARQLQGIAS